MARFDSSSGRLAALAALVLLLLAANLGAVGWFRGAAAGPGATEEEEELDQLLKQREGERKSGKNSETSCTQTV